jgi:hypothetical protein
VWINVVGGIAVLGSYAHGIATHPETRGDLWGGLPAALQPLYSLNMCLAAAGYFLFTSFVLFRLDAERVRVFGYGYGVFPLLYGAILVASALWLPLTFEMLAGPSPALWLAIRLDLAITGLASLALLAAIARVRPHEAPGARRLALVGAAFFCLQTALLDALVWPAWFPA